MASLALAEEIYYKFTERYQVCRKFTRAYKSVGYFVCVCVCMSYLRPPLLAELLGSPDLYVMQIEMDVYTLAKKVRFLEPEKLCS